MPLCSTVCVSEELSASVRGEGLGSLCKGCHGIKLNVLLLQFKLDQTIHEWTIQWRQKEHIEESLSCSCSLVCPSNRLSRHMAVHMSGEMASVLQEVICQILPASRGEDPVMLADLPVCLQVDGATFSCPMEVSTELDTRAIIRV